MFITVLYTYILYASSICIYVDSHSRIGGVTGSVIASSEVDHGFKHWSDQTKDYEIRICCFSHSIKEYEQEIVCSEAAQRVQVKRRVFL
jgi:hypothetical protein